MLWRHWPDRENPIVGASQRTAAFPQQWLSRFVLTWRQAYQVSPPSGPDALGLLSSPLYSSLNLVSLRAHHIPATHPIDLIQSHSPRSSFLAHLFHIRSYKLFFQNHFCLLTIVDASWILLEFSFALFLRRRNK